MFCLIKQKRLVESKSPLLPMQECIDHGDDPGMWLLKTDKHMGAAASLALLPAAQALEAARKPRRVPRRMVHCVS